MLSQDCKTVEGDLGKKHEFIPVPYITSFVKAGTFGPEFVLSSTPLIFFHLNMLISNMCVRTKSHTIIHRQAMNNLM